MAEVGEDLEVIEDLIEGSAEDAAVVEAEEEASVVEEMAVAMEEVAVEEMVDMVEEDVEAVMMAVMGEAVVVIREDTEEVTHLEVVADLPANPKSPFLKM